MSKKILSNIGNFSNFIANYYGARTSGPLLITYIELLVL